MLKTNISPEFKKRRDRLVSQIGTSSAAMILPSSAEVLRNPDVHFPFRQESNLFYLTGFDEPESCLVVAPGPSHNSKDYTVSLFVRTKDPEKELWEGERYGVESAFKIFGVDKTYPIHELETRLPELLKHSQSVYYRVGLEEAADRKVLGALEIWKRSLGRSGRALAPIHDPQSILGEMRLFKSKEEVELLRKACQITAETHRDAMREVKPGQNECEVEALIDYGMRRRGCARMGYGSIVAGGKNATCLHYRSNNEELKKGLLLIDAGGEYEYYTSDITRTFPIGPKFSPLERKVYEVVLKSQLEAIAMAKPGATLPQIHRHVCEVLVDGLIELGAMKGDRTQIIETGAYRRFYPHNTSHWLGMDVHDTGLYQIDGKPRPLEEGMVFTIEPGLYFQPSDMEVAAEFRGIGIRIEDDILITKTGCDVLTQSAPKTIAEIEALREQACS